SLTTRLGTICSQTTFRTTTLNDNFWRTTKLFRGRLARETSRWTMFSFARSTLKSELGCKLAITLACRKAGGVCVRKVECVSFILSRGRKRRF
ncbi:MAG: hypothetical protein ACKO96_49120, partial [Flammeovirgaceae bacterium]